MSLKEAIQILVEKEDAVVGFASIDRFKGSHSISPTDYFPDCKTVIVLGMKVPKDMYLHNSQSLELIERAHQVTCNRLDILSHKVTTFLEQQQAISIPIPALVEPLQSTQREIHNVSLKEMAVQAGLGAQGKNGLIFHPVFGSHLRFAAVFTNVAMPSDKRILMSPCPDDCTICLENCPSQAIGSEYNTLKCQESRSKPKFSLLTLLQPVYFVNNLFEQNHRQNCSNCTCNCPLNT